MVWAMAICPKDYFLSTNTPKKSLLLLKNTSARQCSTLPMSKEAHLHFTITEQHTEAFYKELNLIKPALEERYNITFDVDFSYQKPSTDTVSVTEDNDFFRDEEGNLLFRPAGHGALLSNLNDIDADIIFIKNIDNVVVKKYTDETVFYKEALAGKLCEVQDEIFRILRRIDNNKIKEERSETHTRFPKGNQYHCS